MGNYNYRTKTIRSGELVEVEIYPVYTGGRRLPSEKKNESSDAMKRINQKNAEKKFIRLVNANFGKDDLHITLTHEGELPTKERAEKDVKNFIARLRYRWKKLGLDLSDLRYIYVMEYRTEEEARRAGRPKIRLHHHVLLSKGLNRDVIEELWKHGGCNTVKLKPNVYGPGLLNIASYLAKEPRGSRRWGSSLNLRKPKVTISDTKISRHRAGRMGRDEYERDRVIQKLYPDCHLLTAYTTYNEVNGGTYIYAELRRRDEYENIRYKTAAVRDRQKPLLRT